MFAQSSIPSPYYVCTHLAGLVLGHLVLRVLAALLALAEGPPELGEVDLTSERANKAAAQGEPDSSGDGGGGDGTK